MNREVKDTFIKRSKIISSIRKFWIPRDLMEVETPMLVANAGGAASKTVRDPFQRAGRGLQARISLELYLKRLIVGGLERVL